MKTVDFMCEVVSFGVSVSIHIKYRERNSRNLFEKKIGGNMWNYPTHDTMLPAMIILEFDPNLFEIEICA